MKQERRTTIGEYRWSREGEYWHMDSPIAPDGEGWRMEGSGMYDGTFAWFWVRDVVDTEARSETGPSRVPSSITNMEAYLGAPVSDLIAGIHALVTEKEKGRLLAQRVLEIKAHLKTIQRDVEMIEKERMQPELRIQQRRQDKG